MANYNKVFLMGNLTRDPELRYTPNGTAVVDFGLAVNRRWTGPDGERREETCFVDLQAWARSAEVISEYCRKGSPLFVEGRLRLDTWEGRDGQKRSRLLVVVENFQLLGSPQGGARRTASQETASEEPEVVPEPKETSDFKVDDDIPF